MENETTADLGGQTDIVERSAGGEGALSVRAAANSLVDTRRKDVAPEDDDDKDNAQQQPGEARERATAGEQESDPQGDDTGPDAVPGETQEADPEPKAPPIEPPRSWTKEDKELFKGLPRDTQERLVERERSRESDFLRRQNEAAEKLKGLAAKEQQAEQLRTYYEQALPTLLQALQRTSRSMRIKQIIKTALLNIVSALPAKLKWKRSEQGVTMRGWYRRFVMTRLR